MTTVIRMLVWMFVPLGIVLAVAAPALSAALCRGDEIDPEKASYVALVLQIFCIQLPFAAIEMMVMQAFFSSRRMIAPTVAGFVFSILAAATAYLLVVKGQMTDTTAILTVVTLTLVLARILKSIVLVGLLKWTVPVLPLRATLWFLARLSGAALAAAAAAVVMGRLYAGPLGFIGTDLANPLSRLLHDRFGRVSHLTEVGFIALAGCVVFVALSLLLRMEEPWLCWHWTREKLKRKAVRL